LSGMCDYENFCFELVDGSWPGVVLEVVVAVYSFVGIAIVADEHLTSSLETLCDRWQIPTDVAGASFLALGSAAPEIAIAAISTVKSMAAATEGEVVDDKAAAFASSLGVSSILGSGMLAFTLIPGLCAVVVPRKMELKRRPVARDALSYLVALILLYVAISQGEAYRSNAIWMLATYAVYITATAIAPWVRESFRVSLGMEPSSRRSISGSSGCASDEASTNPMEQGGSALSKPLAAEDSLGSQSGKDEAGDKDEDEDEDDGPAPWYFVPFQPIGAVLSATCPPCEGGSPTEHLYPLTFLMALLWLTIFSAALSAAVTRWGELLEVKGCMMGMYVIAVGAQIPDTLAAVAFAKRGHGSMAVASAVGSQVINVLIGLGLPWLLATSAGLEVPIAETPALQEMSILMFGCVALYLIVLLAPSVPTWGGVGRVTLGRREGIVLIVAYVLVAGGFGVRTALSVE